MWKKNIHLAIGLIIIFLSLYYAFKGVEPSTLFDALKKVNYLHLINAIILISLTFLFRAMRWRYLIRSVKEVKTIDLFSPLFVGFMANLLPARAGEIIRAFLLGKKEGISFSASFATVFIERLFDMAIVLLMLFWVLFFYADSFTHADGTVSNLMGYMITFGWISLLVSLFIFAFSVLLQYKNDWAMKIVHICIKPLPDKWGYKIVEMAHSFTEGLSILRDKKGFLASTILSLLVWITITFTYYPIFQAFDIANELPMLPSIMILTLTIAIFITMFPTPGFLGSFQAACVVALHEIYKIPKATAASYGIVAWLTVMGFIIIVGAVFVLKDHISLKEFLEKGKTEET